MYYLYNIFYLSRRKGQLLPNKILFYAVLLYFFASCSSISYISGLYEQQPAQRVDLVVRVEDNKGVALTDLTLNDFYVLHNDQPLERKNELRLNESLSNVKLYVVILVDTRENPGLKNSFERTRSALNAYLALSPDNIYIKLIRYDTKAEVLHENFTNDRAELQMLLQELHTVQVAEDNESSGLEPALALAQESIESLPHGSRVLDPQMFPVAVTNNTDESPLYDTAIVLMNHNSLNQETLRSYYGEYNLVIMDSVGQLKKMAKRNGLGQLSDNNKNNPSNIFHIYEFPRGDLNKNLDQTKTAELMNQAWDLLNNIVNGYYWLTYHKYTDVNRQEPNFVHISLTQYGRSSSEGLLATSTYGGEIAESDSLKKESVVDLNGFPVSMSDAVGINNLSEWEDGDENNQDSFDLLPPSIVVSNSDKADEDSLADIMDNTAADEWLSLLPGRQESKTEVESIYEEDPSDNLLVQDIPFSTEDFEVLSSLSQGPASTGHLVNSSLDGDLGYEEKDKASLTPQYTAEPIQLVSNLSEPKVVEESTNKENEGRSLANLNLGHYIQVGAFIQLDNLYDVIERLSGDYSVQAFSSTVNGKEYNRCIIGPFSSKAKTRVVLQRLKTLGGLQDAFIIRQPIAEWIK